MALTVADVITEFGAYYRNEGQGVKDIIGVYYQPSVTHGYFNPVPTTQTQERRTKFLKSSVLQRYQKTFTPKGGGEFKPSKIDLAHMKVDEQEVLDELIRSWNGFLVGLNTADKKSWPFSRWYVTEILNQVTSDYELHEVYHGEEGVVVDGTPTASGASMDGLGKQIADGIASSEIVPVNGAPDWSTDPADFVQEIEAWVKAVEATSNEHRLIVENEIDYIFMSVELRKRYAAGLRKLYNMNYDQTGVEFTGMKLELPLVDSNIKIVGLPSMTGAKRIFMTPKSNRAAFDRVPNVPSVLQVESVDRSLKMFGDVWKGIGFWYKPFVFVNQLA